MKEGTLYRHILGNAWKLTWRNRALWVLGLLSVFWGGIGAYQPFNRALENVGPTISERLIQGRGAGWIPQLSNFTPGSLATLAVFLLITLALLGGFIVLVTSARGGLIFALARRHENRPAQLRVALRRGAEVFWPLLGIGIITRLDIPLYIYLLNSIVSGPAAPAQLFLYVSVFVVVTVISIILGLLGIYASALVVLEGVPFLSALSQSIRLFARNWLVSLELALILYVINLLVGIAILAGLFAAGIPFVLLGLIFTSLKVPGGLMTVIIPAAILGILLLIVAGAIFVTFQYAAWVLLYLRIRETRAVAKIVRLTSRFAHILHRRIA
ncbi:hypothetical protein A3B21_03900 [Candidatus Uhrbacteria bacterium RIFCSPLOWO2_01_FULL_47_24]|uniref:DUF7847 domain-containing protein n=1 Tax=Candidatus Uhrbacteria bacterium RIFCSPLOWO2_01_FULL_47_24 TaxID=1802401 RepID=A0A1F7UT94_9BACT|nr:MAG: hypothetical protein A2753_00645 [Candidatus Uhrbacteria bacterium RIFCSPHIGHO2_01_FULL_47_11]OGL69114.1 MAG: hypothetical protein A3D58_02600 [Candidatus Uhrbacteria bacterium RIFCSPHIGHO2_02_FULL_46_47]OGL75725.1 MAG: hypothetical protein A3F52_02325 [Candidatus Uhrbacteria bacterium RIFCSPHIGHO2_12_FULL_47_11]OGL81485.1 MAG: hypothetical protein A3B21_03900 [Candidatus Uhrbacteria bacterium RIFCSPLOWO2_01_FULL_47_24]OGL83730.1 MAG: hypothetical protein A3J03_01355 [Candidatus Uhrbact